MKSLGSSASSNSSIQSEIHVSFIPISSSVDNKRKHEELSDQCHTLTKMDLEDDEEEVMYDQHDHSSFSFGDQKKRRLSVEQVKALEKTFEVENKLDPERKMKLAHDLGLQPRQVAVWFQNRRARWKTKQLERDYNTLKALYENLKLNFDSLYNEKQSMTTEIRELKSKLANSDEVSAMTNKFASTAEKEERPSAMLYLRTISDSSDSSAVFNDHETSPPNYSGVVLDQHYCFMGLTNDEIKIKDDDNKYLEEGLMSSEDLCSSLFSEEQAQSISWC